MSNSNNFLPSSPIRYLLRIGALLPKLPLAFSLLFATVGQGLYMLLPGVIGLLINQVFVRSNWPLYSLMLFPVIWLLSTAMLSVSKMGTSIVVQDVRKVSKLLAFRHAIYSPNQIYVTRDAGGVEHLVQELSFNSRYVFGESAIFFLRGIVTLMVALLMVIAISREIAVVVLGWGCIYLPLGYISAKWSVKHVAASLSSAASVSTATVDVIANHELIPAFGTEQEEVSRYETILEKEKSSFRQAQFQIDVSELFQRCLQVLLPISVGLMLVLSGGVSKLGAGAIASIFATMLVLAYQLGDFSRCLLAFFEVKERLNAALQELALPKSLKVPTNHRSEIALKEWSIFFDGVTFRYSKGPPAVDSVILKIAQNQKVGLVGPSGAGKTTLLKLLRGCYRPSKGLISIGGHNLSHIEQSLIVQSIAEVSQSIPLFHRSVRENVAYGCPHKSDDEIWTMLERAQMAERVRKMPGRLDAIIGVRGQKLSGGERARLAIARAFIRDAKIIVLDEATASLDSESEILLQKGLEELMKGRTVIAISHRLSTLRLMDTLIFLSKGRVVSQGSHEELLETIPDYRSLWQDQVVINR